MSQPESALDAALEKLREQHVRITPQRKLILDYLMTHENHPPVETIYQELAPQMASLSLATVYNTLNLFVELGIVIEIPNENGGVRYDFFLVGLTITPSVKTVEKSRTSMIRTSHRLMKCCRTRLRPSPVTPSIVVILSCTDFVQNAKRRALL